MSVYTETIDVNKAYERLFEASTVTRPADVFADPYLSQEFDANVLLVSELGQRTGAYKFRGSYNWFSQHVASDIEEVVCFSAGNHAAAVADCAQLFGLKARIFMPESTPEFKRNLVQQLGGRCVEIVLTGKTVDDAAVEGRRYLTETNTRTGFIHPYDDDYVVAGQGTLGRELDEAVPGLDIIISPVGGGGLLSGLIHATKHHRTIHYVGAEPMGAASLQYALENEGRALNSIDTFVDGAAVRKVGNIILNTLAEVEDRYSLVHPDNLTLKKHLTRMWGNGQGVRPELAGVLSIAALENARSFVRGKTVACVVSGGNLSQQRFENEIKIVQ